MKITDAKKLEKCARNASDLLKALSNPERLMILCHLVEGEQTAGDLWYRSSLSQSAFSQHLAILREQGMVSTRKEMQTVYYSLTNSEALKLLEALHKIYCLSD